VDGLVAGDRPPGTPKRSEMLTRVDPSLDRAVVLFQNVIQVQHRSMPAIPLKGAFGFESHDRGRIRAVTVGVDDSRRRMVCSAERFGKKALGRGRGLLGREQEVDRRAGRIHRPLKVTPLAFHPDVRLVHAPAVGARFEPRAQTSFHFRGVTLDRSPHRDVIGVQAALGKEFLHVAIRE
jgi:hypothetical protein